MLWGGETTEVTDNTTNVLLESALFDRLSVRKASTRLGLRSESSARFGKGIDPKRTELAINRAAQLLAELANGQVCEGIVSYDELTVEPVSICITAEKINSVLGTNMSNEEVANVWTRLNFTYDLNDDMFTVHVPSRRFRILQLLKI